jgi:hypothetical protein
MLTNPTRAPAAARTTELDPRAARSRVRRRLHEPRPTSTPEINARIGRWKAEVKAACLAGFISKGGDKYLHELLTIPSVARGDYCLYSDKAMGQRINVSGRTVRRHRKDAAIHGLVEVLGCGKDHRPCMVRPILRDGSPVFLSRSELAGRSDTFGRLTRPVLAAELLLTDTLRTEEPPLPPASAAPEKGGAVLNLVEDEARQMPPELLESEEAPTQPPNPKTAPADSAAAPTAIQPAMTFLEFWLAMGRTGSEGYARAKWSKLSAADKAAIRIRLGRPRSWAADMWAGKWLECRVWEEAGPAERPAQVFIREGTAEWRSWQRHLMAVKGRSSPMNGDGGWWFPTKLPPLG